MKKTGLPYEEAAEERTVSGWCCKTCNRFWGDDEHMSRWCCASSLACECGKRITESRTCCDACYAKHRGEVYAAMSQVEWDGETPLCMYDDDKFFFDAESIGDYIEGEEGRTLEGLQLVLCEKNVPRSFEMQDYLSDDLGEDGDLSGTGEIDKIVNDWIEANCPTLWYPCNKRPTLESLRTACGMQI